MHWMAVLRSCCSIEAYRRHYLGDMDPIAGGGVFDSGEEFPAKHPIQRDRGAGGDQRDPRRDRAAMRSIRRSEFLAGLMRIWNMLRLAEIFDRRALPSYLQRIQTTMHEAALAVQQSYFMH